MAQQCAVQKLAAVEKLPEAPLTNAGESKVFDFNSKYKKHRKRHRQEIKIKERGHVQHDKFREMPAAAPEEVTLPGTSLQVDPLKLLVVPPRPSPAPDELFSLRCSQVSPPKRLVVPPSPTPAPDEVFALQCSSDEVCPPSLLKPQPATSSLFEPPPQLMLIDTEDEENEYVEYTGKTVQACDLLKSERPRLLEAEINTRMPAWLESGSEVLEEVWASEVVEVLGFEEEKDSKAICMKPLRKRRRWMST
ncbi:pollen-specific leucine-rich repeat extensin 1 isoform X2 [Labeo rohita]|uniref:Pollen-specific leucine-rich repeat extensin 1 isoform X2 n=1 Tax=Labeo rohita TaxID=84645 RepID=A0A498P4Q4_LABRO|nr:pollen-specific leucine-rich repeat extensin 1 isoform X2 [Labeo rohita]RXN39205.1 pollen-specific leucine-rich repeat extensin 1 isoform X2 [Labeo rohita]